jgi:hypothetical protein
MDRGGRGAAEPVALDHDLGNRSEAVVGQYWLTAEIQVAGAWLQDITAHTVVAHRH